MGMSRMTVVTAELVWRQSFSVGPSSLADASSRCKALLWPCPLLLHNDEGGRESCHLGFVLTSQPSR